MDRIAMLTEILSQNPADAFARYGLAMEYSNSGDIERALEEFAKLLAAHPDYTAGYFMAAQTLAKAERTPEARKMLVDCHADGTELVGEGFLCVLSVLCGLKILNAEVAKRAHRSQRKPANHYTRRAIFTMVRSTSPGNN
jgi:hypothetical protein